MASLGKVVICTTWKLLQWTAMTRASNAQRICESCETEPGHSQDSQVRNEMHTYAEFAGEPGVTMRYARLHTLPFQILPPSRGTRRPLSTRI